jgi:hypothetical protein
MTNILFIERRFLNVPLIVWRSLVDPGGEFIDFTIGQFPAIFGHRGSELVVLHNGLKQYAVE